MLAAVPFASCYVYSPQGTCAISVRSRLLCARLKDRDPRFLARYAARVRREALEAHRFAGWFDAATILVPVPGSVPRAPGTASTPEALALAMLAVGLGGRLWLGLRRAIPVPKSATAAGGRRPSVASHYASFAVEQPMDATPKLLLVDDVVTKGRTLMAAASRLQEACPQAHITAFALLRTMGLVAEVTRLIDPCVGKIHWRRGDAHRRP
jgi:predicted amidophosphoribosyltransferase